MCLWGHDPAALPDNCKTAIVAAGAKLVGEGWIRALGAPVGVNLAAMKAEALRIVESHETLMQRLLSRNLSSQEAVAVLRVCAVPKINHLLRCTRPSITAPAAAKFEQLVRAIGSRRLWSGRPFKSVPYRVVCGASKRSTLTQDIPCR